MSRSKTFFLSLLLLLAAGYVGLRLSQGDAFETRLGALLPLGQTERIEAVLEQLAERGGGQLYFLLQGPGPEDLRRAGAFLRQALLDSGRMVPGQRPADWLAFFSERPWVKWPQPHQAALASNQSAEKLALLVESALASPFGPPGDPSGDPLFTLSARLAELEGVQPTGEVAGPFRLFSGPALGFRLRLSHSPFDYRATAEDRVLVERLEQELAQQFPQIKLTWIGLSRYADRSAAAAQSEMSLIGGLSLAGILGLVFWAFRSVRILGLGLAILFCGLLWALAGSLWVFGSLHVITLVFGASLTGVAIDYAFHGFTQTRITPQGPIRAIAPALLLGMGSSVLAYGALGLAPFAGLRQVALFSALGLSGALVAVFWLVPLGLPQEPSRREPALLAWGQWYLARFERLRPGWVALGLLVVMAPGWFLLQANDDVALLAPRPPDLVAAERAVAERMPEMHLSAFFLVEAEDPEQLAQRLEQLQSHLAGRSLALFWSSPQAQTKSLDALRQAWRKGLAQRLAQLGYGQDFLDTLGERWEKARPVALGDLPNEGLYVTHQGRYYAPFLPLRRPAQQVAQQLAQAPGLYWVDQRAQASELLGRYRRGGAWFLAFAYGAIALLMGLRYGPKGGLAVAAAPVLAASCLLGALGYLGVPVNLFHLLGLVLVLGVGIDYSLFFAETQHNPEKTFMALVLSAGTSLLAFGLLAFSQTGALSALGQSTGFGVLLALAFSPLAKQRS